ncbi:MAG: N-acetyltransferase [bacterium]
MNITLRDADQNDAGFLFAVYASTRAEEMALVPWSEEQREGFLRMQFDAQNSYYHEQFPDAEYKAILAEGEPVGRLYVARDAEVIHILDIAVLPESRRQGVGSTLIQELITEAETQGKAVQVYVESPGALNLFERFGFTKVAEEGFNLLLKWRAVSRDPQSS